MSSNTSLPITNFVTPWDLKRQRENNTSKPILSHDSSSSSSLLDKQPNVPECFIWGRDADNIGRPNDKLDVTVIDLEGFFKGDESDTQHAAHLLRMACTEHGFFYVINHGVDSKLLDEAYDRLDDFFKLPTTQKLKASKETGSRWGFVQAHTDRLFSTNLPWKETLSFPYYANDTGNMVVKFFTSKMGNEFEPMGMVYQKYCEAMNKLSLTIMELLAISLGVERTYYKDFFKDARSSVRCNYYPTCEEPNKVVGTGPHCDANSLTILHQDQVGGLQVFVNNKWQAVEPRPDALLINIGDTFTALSNGIYKSCLHRALVNEEEERLSIAFFLSPRGDKIIKSPEIISNNPTRKYPEFTWADLVGFTQKHYFADGNTLQSFVDWFSSSNSKFTP